MRSIITIVSLLLLAVAAWGGFGLLLYTLENDRVRYAEAAAAMKEQSSQEEYIARLRSGIQNTEVERAALESIVGLTVLQVVETIEAAGKEAGATKVTIGEATPSGKTPQGVPSVAFTVNAEGPFAAMVRTASLFEVLPIPVAVESFQLEKAEKTWRLTIRVRVIMEKS